jgi:hypothetical protein
MKFFATITFRMKDFYPKWCEWVKLFVNKGGLWG